MDGRYVSAFEKSLWYKTSALVKHLLGTSEHSWLLTKPCPGNHRSHVTEWILPQSHPSVSYLGVAMPLLPSMLRSEGLYRQAVELLVPAFFS